MRYLLTAVVAVVVLHAGLAWAHTIYIKPDGTGDAATIQAGIDQAISGDTLLLASGTFQGEGNYNIVYPNKTLLIRSETGNAADCIIDCEGTPGGFDRYAISIQGGHLVLDGVTIQNANNSAVHTYNVPPGGTGLYLTVRNCVFFSNSASAGGAVYCDDFYGEDVIITNSKFISNEAYDGAAIWIYGVYLDVTIDGCTFSDNHALGGIGGGGAICCYAHEARAFIRRSVFVHNTADYGVGAISVVNMYADISRCTFFANSGPEASAIGTGYVGASVDHCIMAYGTGGEGFHFTDDEYFEPSIGCTDIYGNEGGDWVGRIAGKLGQGGNFSACPAFCNFEVEPYDLYLCSASPCLPGNHPQGYNCGLIGALGQGCVCGPTETQPSTWGAIKAMYR